MEKKTGKGGAAYKYVTGQWAKAKREYIKKQVEKGYGYSTAEQNWKRTRLHLKKSTDPRLPPEHLFQGKDALPPSALLDNQAGPSTDGPRPIDEEERTAKAREERLERAKQAREKYLDEVRKNQIETVDKRGAETAGLSDQEEPPAAKKQVTIPDTSNSDSQDAQPLPNLPDDMPEQDIVDGDGGPGPIAPVGGGLGPGLADARGGLQGGGLAGAGNNAFHHRFGGATQPRCPEDYTYVDTYKRSFMTHTNFPDVTDSIAATISTKPTLTMDALEPLNANFPTSMCKATMDHGGIFIPYWVVEASMKPCDWNKPLDHVAYEVVEYGFNIPNFRLNILNNDRATPEAVAQAPPADARMWMFVDTNNDYGIVETYDNSLVSHNYGFNNEEIIDADVKEYQLPRLGHRQLLLDPPIIGTIRQSGLWTQDGDEMQSDDANALYDLKRHPGYKEFILSEAKMGMSYQPNTPTIRLPHPAQTTLDLSCRQKDHWPDYRTMTNYGQDTLNCHQWNTTYDPLYQNQPQIDDVQKLGLLQYYAHTVGPLTSQITDTGAAGAGPDQQILDRYGDQGILMQPIASLDADLAGRTRTRKYGRPNVSDDGKWVGKAHSKRPPIFMFGIHKELEYRAKPEFWQYWGYGQVEYYVKIKWHVQPCKFPSYIPIGLGGVWTVDEQGFQRDWIEATIKKTLRRSNKPLLHTTAHEQEESVTDVSCIHKL